MRPNYPFNCWYVAATTDEVGRDLLARRLLGIPVVLYRRSSGDVVAMEDRCVHRAYPLSEGRLDGDRLVCGYHGFVYDPDGRCVDVPSQERVPQGACVRTYAVHEQPPFVWIWLGEPGAAALRRRPSRAGLHPPRELTLQRAQVGGRNRRGIVDAARARFPDDRLRAPTARFFGLQTSLGAPTSGQAAQSKADRVAAA